MASFHIGQRLSYSGSRCTVWYVGEVDGTNGPWLGVEWDDPTQGKHRGEHEGVKYFQCLSNLLTAGSFIRPTRSFDRPRSFLEALRKKYVVDESLAAETPDVIEISGKVVEEVGLDKVRARLAALHELKIVLLDGHCLAGLDSKPWSGDRTAFDACVREIEDTCPNVAELDLSLNLLEDWTDVIGICKALPKLRSLKLNFNRLTPFHAPQIEPSEQLQAFASIRDLHLDGTLMTWEKAIDLASRFSSLETLSVASNDLRSIYKPLQPKSIKSLDLSYNTILSLPSLKPLTALPSLTSLCLRSNQISSITPPKTTLTFAQVKHLDLSSNLLRTQTSISHLPPIFPALKSLLTSHNSFTKPPPDAKEIRLLTIARIGTLTSLNHSTITPYERLNADVFYLNKITAQLSSSPVAEKSSIIANKHPRYPELCKEYEAAPPDATSANTDPDRYTPAARLITFNLYLPTSEDHKTSETRDSTTHSFTESSSENHTIRLPKSITPYRLKAFTGDLFCIPPMQLRLIWETNEFDPVHTHHPGSADEQEDESNGVTKWNVPDNWVGEEGDERADGSAAGAKDERARLNQKGFVRREVELVDGTREVGFWVVGKEARVRVEIRRGTE